MHYNPLLDVDSYKASHTKLYPKDMTYTFSYIESRGGEFPATLFFGLQYLLKEYLSKGFTIRDVRDAHAFFIKHGLPFNLVGWEKMYNKCQMDNQDRAYLKVTRMPFLRRLLRESQESLHFPDQRETR